MGEIITTATRKVTRAQIVDAVGNNPRLIRLLEALIQDVTTAIPTAIVDGEVAARFSLQPADGSKSTAQAGLKLAQDLEALTLGMQRSESASIGVVRDQVDMLQAQAAMQRGAAGMVDQLRAEVDQLRAMVLAMRDQSTTINQLRAEVETLRALQLGV